jgi:hypothetical protein
LKKAGRVVCSLAGAAKFAGYDVTVGWGGGQAKGALTLDLESSESITERHVTRPPGFAPVARPLPDGLDRIDKGPVVGDPELGKCGEGHSYRETGCDDVRKGECNVA